MSANIIVVKSVIRRMIDLYSEAASGGANKPPVSSSRLNSLGEDAVNSKLFEKARAIPEANQASETIGEEATASAGWTLTNLLLSSFSFWKFELIVYIVFFCHVFFCIRIVFRILTNSGCDIRSVGSDIGTRALNFGSTWKKEIGFVLFLLGLESKASFRCSHSISGAATKILKRVWNTIFTGAMLTSAYFGYYTFRYTTDQVEDMIDATEKPENEFFGSSVSFTAQFISFSDTSRHKLHPQICLALLLHFAYSLSTSWDYIIVSSHCAQIWTSLFSWKVIVSKCNPWCEKGNSFIPHACSEDGSIFKNSLTNCS